MQYTDKELVNQAIEYLKTEGYTPENNLVLFGCGIKSKLDRKFLKRFVREFIVPDKIYLTDILFGEETHKNMFEAIDFYYPVCKGHVPMFTVLAKSSISYIDTTNAFVISFNHQMAYFPSLCDNDDSLQRQLSKLKEAKKFATFNYQKK